MYWGNDRAKLLSDGDVCLTITIVVSSITYAVCLLDERDIGRGLSSGCGHVAMIALSLYKLLPLVSILAYLIGS